MAEPDEPVNLPRNLERYLDGEITTNDGSPPASFEPGAPGEINPLTKQHTQYWVLSEAERAKGFVRPVRTQYQHTRCESITGMGLAIAETYARNPTFYGRTFCCRCGAHYPVGEHGEFVWLDERGEPTTEKVGT